MKKLFKNILVPVDFSPMSIRALKYAQRFATRFGGVVHLANVQVFSYASFSPLSIETAAPLLSLQDRRAGAQSALAKLAKRHGVKGSCRVEAGTAPFAVLCEIARELKADVIVTPTHGHGRLKRFLLGSTAERLVQHSPCPVLVLRGRAALNKKIDTRLAPKIGRILVPVDFSACSFDGLKYAIAFARNCEAQLLVFYVVDNGQIFTVNGFHVQDLSIYDEHSLEAAVRDMAAFVGAANFHGVPYETATRIGDPAEGICTFARNQKADLIITSTHGYTGLSHVRLGSIAERIVRQASCPVLVVPSHPEAKVAQTFSRRSRARQHGMKAFHRSRRARVGSSKEVARGLWNLKRQ